MPQTSMLQDLGSTPASCLVSRCRAQSVEPWLFFRRGWTWRWASYGQVADQMARSLRIVRRAATSAPKAVRWGTHGTQHPDAVAVACMLLEAGGTLRLRRPQADGSWPPGHADDNGTRWVHAVTEASGDGETPEASTEPGYLAVPTVAGQLDRRPLEALDPASLDTDAVSQVEDGEGSLWTLSELRDRARRLAQVLVEEHRPQDADSRLGRWRARRRLPRRPIVCVSPALSPVDQLVTAWATLALGAAWILEPQVDAFLATVDWARPTVVVTDPGREKELHRRLVALPRRQRRLRSVVGRSSDTPETMDFQLWQALGIGRSLFP